MKATRQSGWAMTAMMAAVLTMQLAAQTATQQVAANPATANQQAPVAAKRVIVVSLEDRKLALVEDGKVVKTYIVAVGKPSTPSPVGTFTIARRVMNPTYSHDGRTVPPAPNNPVGSRWMGLSIPGYGIHGTNVPSSIGKAASHGCIRMAKADLEELYPMVAVGDTVELIGQRNEETAQLFGDGQTPAPAETQLAAQSAKPAPAAQTQQATAQVAPATAEQTSANARTTSSSAPTTLAAAAALTLASSL
ncbi:MAG: L,D-transpeptidase [Terracidiphilus sp.]